MKQKLNQTLTPPLPYFLIINWEGDLGMAKLSINIDKGTIDKILIARKTIDNYRQEKILLFYIKKKSLMIEFFEENILL